VSTKIQTDELKRIEAASADNVIMLVDATVLWRVSNVDTAVRMSVETMHSDGSKANPTTEKLCNDILKQAEASLAFFVGTINFSDSMAAAAMTQRSRDKERELPVAVAQRAPAQGPSSDNTPHHQEAVEFNLYHNDKLDDAMSHANEITKTYGVEIISINIISAIPGDKKLQESLAAGAVAAAEAQMMEITAQGKSRAMKIEAKAKAEQTMILAKADADADILRAEGAKQAADMLSTNAVSVDLAKIDRTGKALAGEGNHASFFFGAQPQDIQHLLANCSVVKGTPE
jgi:regulator of protease activity HflC (stomatin/prohibitin superfamily)